MYPERLSGYAVMLSNSFHEICCKYLFLYIIWLLLYKYMILT